MTNLDRQETLFRAAVWALAVGAFLWYMWVACTQFASNRTFLADVGVFNVLCSGPLHGHWLRTPLAPDAPGNYFGIHFQPYLLAITPFYAIHDHTTTLLAAFSLSLGLAGVPLAFATRRLTNSRCVALGVQTLYHTNHFLLSIHLAHHPESLAIPWIFLMFWGLVAEKRAVLIGSLLAALAVKGDFAVFLGLFWALEACRRNNRPLALTCLAICAGWWVLALVVSHLSGAAWFAAQGMTPVSRFASMGSTKLEIALHLATHPLDVAQRIFREPLFALIVCVTGLCLLDWRGVWAGLAAAAIFLVTDDPIIRELQYYYSYGAFPLLMISAVRGSVVFLDINERRALMARLLAGFLVANGVWMLMKPTRTDGLMHRPFPVSDRDRLTEEVMALIPPDAPVAAQFDLFPRVPNRRDLFPLREAFLDRVAYVAINLEGRAPDLQGDERERVFARLSSSEWETVEPTPLENFLILRKAKATDPPP